MPRGLQEFRITEVRLHKDVSIEAWRPQSQNVLDLRRIAQCKISKGSRSPDIC